MKPIRIIGVGNIFAGDDAIGPLIINALKAKSWGEVDLIEAGVSGLQMLDLLNGAEGVIVIDAVQSGKPPGTIHRLTIPNDLGLLLQSSWSSKAMSTHGFGLGEVLTLGQTLGTLPQTLLVYGIELGQTELGAEVSSNVKDIIDTVVLRIEKDVETRLCTNSSS